MADATGLTGGQKGLLKESMDIIATDLAEMGLALFAEVFNRYPQYQKKFRKIADMSTADAMKTTRMKSHATLVMGALRTIVNNLKDPELTMDLLETLGVRHKLMGSLSKADFDNVFVVFLDILKDKAATKSTTDPAGTMSAWKVLQYLRFFLYLQETSTMADATGLTGTQKGLLKESMDIISKDLAGLGLALFAEVFNRYPQYQKKFRKIADMSAPDAMKTTRMKSHATLVMGALRTIVNNLKDPELTMDLLETLGVRHKLMGSLSKADFDNVFVVLLEILKNNPATQSTTNPAGAMEAWKALLNTIGSQIGSQL
ncbi:unnamed protein product [Cyprideis torosa]|uniref:Globin domain-containing protein n=1 Tax=Cyprideis torosa TaxID=163714 RepID=A0A7R8WEB4_9CRUS|nr:unnamed protein product [Cyprideis torosa]CAG0890098.1 unnamed protein product [Cyprideis torosa]